MENLCIVLGSDECHPYISWLPSGNSICVNHKDTFVKKVLTKYFGETDFNKFVSTLTSNGFKRAASIDDFDGDAVYSHGLFRIGRPDLLAQMSRGLNTGSDIRRNGDAERRSLSQDMMMTGSVGDNNTPLSQQVNVSDTFERTGVMVHRMNPGNTMLQTHSDNWCHPRQCINPGVASLIMNRQQAMQRLPIPQQTSVVNVPRRHSDSMVVPRQQVNRNIMQGTFNYYHPLTHSHKITRSYPQQQPTFNMMRSQSNPCINDEDTVENIKMAMLDIDRELLRVKELKLLAAQRKLQIDLEKKEKK